MFRMSVCVALAGGLVLSLASGCESLPGDEKTQGAVIGGVGGAAAGAVIGGEDNRLLGALVGGALGAGGGYLIGSSMEGDDKKEKDEAVEAAKHAEVSPATAEQAKRATSADVNRDGYVTMDEVVAMEKAGFSDTEMISRLEKTGMFFELTPQQREYLRTNNVSDRVISEMQTMNPDARERAAKRLEKQKEKPVDTTPVGRT